LLVGVAPILRAIDIRRCVAQKSKTAHPNAVRPELAQFVSNNLRAPVSRELDMTGPTLMSDEQTRRVEGAYTEAGSVCNQFFSSISATWQ